MLVSLHLATLAGAPLSLPGRGRVEGGVGPFLGAGVKGRAPRQAHCRAEAGAPVRGPQLWPPHSIKRLGEIHANVFK